MPGVPHLSTTINLRLSYLHPFRNLPMPMTRKSLQRFVRFLRVPGSKLNLSSLRLNAPLVVGGMMSVRVITGKEKQPGKHFSIINARQIGKIISFTLVYLNVLLTEPKMNIILGITIIYQNQKTSELCSHFFALERGYQRR